MDFGERVAAVRALKRPIAHGEGADRMRQHLNRTRKQVQAMTPERLQEIRRNKTTDFGPLTSDVEELRDGYRELSKERRDLLEYIDLIHEDLRITRAERDAEKHKNLVVKQELHLYKTQMREARAIAWDAGAQAGLDWDKNYPGNIRDSNPFKENK